MTEDFTSGTISFDGRVAIVTGAGGGLGRSYALELARRGASVVVNDFGGGLDGSGGAQTAADVVVDEIRSSGGEAIASYDSVATPEGGASICAGALESFGRIDVVVSNAGILRDRSFANMTMDDIHAVVDVHLLGAFHVCQPAFVTMKEQGYGRLVLTASNSGLLGNFGQANYGAAKMGLVGLSNVMAIEGARYGISSNVIAPVARTRMTEALLGPLAEFVDPDQVTPMVVYLCSEANPYTHEVFSAGGGRYARFVVGVNDGWFAGARQIPTVEDLAAHIDEVRAVATHHVFNSAAEELALIGGLLQQ
jgi:NAD(P)-dependent dehydrogenase (short-subunit alcohol dehydrogenase family)